MTSTVESTTLPLKPIEPEFIEHVRHTIGHRGQVEHLVDDVVKRGLRNVFFVGAGGSLIASYPAYWILMRAAQFPVFQIQSDELNTTRPAALGHGSLVVVASYTGTTKETVAAARWAKSRGAIIVAAGKAGSPLVELADLAITGENSDIAEALVAYALLQRLGVPSDYDAVWRAIDALPEALRVAQEEAEGRVHDVAEALKDEPITYVLGSGPNYGWAYGLAMCYLQEMQWKHAAAYDSGEFFQGAFEVIDEQSAVILLLGEDASRPMGERAKTFLEKYTKKAHYLDTAQLSLPGVPAELRGDMSPFALRVVIGRLAKHYESVRGHDLGQRHYMFKVEY